MSRGVIFGLRLASILAVLILWEIVARSGLLYRDVVPSLIDIGAALVNLVASADTYAHIGWTFMEVSAALSIGGIAGIAAGVLLGANRFLRRAYEPYLYYFGATPKLIFFPLMIMWFGVGPSSKIALAAVTCFFPVALSTLSGMRGINPVFLRVGRTFRASNWQTVRKIYLPAMRQPILTGLRLGLGLAMVVTLLAETKLSNRGLGHLVIQAFTIFDMPRMYALLAAIFFFAIGANILLARLEDSRLGGHAGSALAY
jgi:ABC-type nitrate/sulfonate/bicarbonate transport system permease component